MSGDSTLYQITHLYDFTANALDSDKEVRAACYVSQVFNKVCHKDILFKLKSCGIDTYITVVKQLP